MVNALARASLQPAGSVPPVAKLAPGQYELEIVKSVSDGGRDAETPFGNEDSVLEQYLDENPDVVKDLVAAKITNLPAAKAALAGKGITALPATEFGERFYVDVKYPDPTNPEGFVKQHQVKNVGALVPRIIDVLRVRYGVEAATATAIANTLNAGETLTVTVG